MIGIALIGLLALAAVGLYLYEVLVLGEAPQAHLARTLATVAALIAAAIRLGRGTRKSLAVYEQAYKKEVGDAFSDRPLLRKQLLCACRLYDEGNLAKALKYLNRLMVQVKRREEAFAVLLFSALCFSEAGQAPNAVKLYLQILEMDPKNERIHSNTGFEYIAIGDYERAIYHFDKAVALRSDYYYAYANRANCYFRMQEHEKALEDCLEAIRLKNNGKEALGLATILYAMAGDGENKQKYFRMAVAAGRSPDELNEAIKTYCTGVYEEEEEAGE